jgi:hypothetical protein
MDQPPLSLLERAIEHELRYSMLGMVRVGFSTDSEGTLSCD